LNYLRNGQLILTDERIKEELLEEAKFYQVQGVIEQLEDRKPTSPGLLGSSLIVMNDTHQSTLQSWLPPNATCSLLYRASTDGYTPANFHRCCDNKGPTLLVIRSGEYIFGGYTSKSWESGMQLIDNFYSTMKNYHSCLSYSSTEKNQPFSTSDTNDML